MLPKMLKLIGRCLMAAALTTGANAQERPALPEVERMRMTDEALFEALDPSYSEMTEVLDIWKRDGIAVGKAALATSGK